MKQIIISIAMLAIALALIAGAVIPLMEHGTDTGGSAVSEGRAALPAVQGLFK